MDGMKLVIDGAPTKVTSLFFHRDHLMDGITPDGTILLKTGQEWITYQDADELWHALPVDDYSVSYGSVMVKTKK